MSTVAAAAVDRASAGSGTYLVFTLGDEEYGIEVSSVREIIGAIPVTRVPRMPESVRGVINLRGRIIPVADLRIRFGLPAVDHGQRTCIIVVQSCAAVFGLVVDRVLEVARIAADEIEDPPAFGADVDTEYLRGIARNGARVRLLLDVERTLSPQEAGAMALAAEG